MLTSGSRLAHYEVVARVGAGGQGEVYRARDARLKRDVALKALPPDAVGDPERRKRLELEAELLAKLNHPGIATIHGVEDAEGSTYLIMELIDGETLAERIARRPLSPEEARSLFHGIADALEAAHEQGVIHQDLKPSNVMIRRDGKPKLLDFGLGMKTFQPEPGPEATTVDQPAPAGRAVGTPRYMSPEQVRGQPVDARTDVWAFGCCLFESLTGMPAFEGETVADISSAILEREPNWQRLPERLPPNLTRLLRRCLVKDRRRRLRHIGDAVIELEESGVDLDVAAPSKRRWKATASMQAIGIGTAVLLAAVIWAVWGIEGPTRREPLRATVPLEGSSAGLKSTVSAAA